MLPKISGVIITNGSSLMILAQKYEVAVYMLLLTSRRNIGLSSGKIRITFWIALNAIFIVEKKRAPYMF